jgi:hypothetical protein
MTTENEGNMTTRRTRHEICVAEDLIDAQKRKLIDLLRDARNKGLTEYNTGRPCKHGHTANRSVKTNRCMQCDSVARGDPDDNRLKKRCIKYGISVEQYQQMWIGQRGKCALCLIELAQKPVIDHCHITGEVRSLLCTMCNSMLGFAKDNPETLRAGAKYIDMFTSRPQ